MTQEKQKQPETNDNNVPKQNQPKDGGIGTSDGVITTENEDTETDRATDVDKSEYHKIRHYCIS